MRSLVRLPLAGALVSITLAIPAHAAEPIPEAEHLPHPPDRYTQAQDLLERGNVVGAAELWEAMLTDVSESDETQASREAILLNAIDARMEAYRRQVTAAGEREPLHLLEAQIVLRRYLRAHAAAYRDSRALSEPIQQRAAALALALAEATPPSRVSPPARSSAGLAGAVPPAHTPPNNGNGLLVGGIGLGVLGFAAALTMIPLGAALGRNADNIYTVSMINAANTSGDAQRSLYLADAQEAERAGRTANRVAIAGGIISPLMLGGAAAMIVFGLQRRRAARVDTIRHGPQLSPDYAGWSATARF